MVSAVGHVSAKAPRASQEANLSIPAFDMKLFLASAGRGRRVSKFQRKKTIFTQGDPAGTVMYIQEGAVKVSVVNAMGKEAVVALLGPGDFCGEGCLTGLPFRMATATAISPTSLLVINKAEMVRLLRDEHKLSDRFITYLLTRNIRVEEDLIDQLFNSIEKRLARTLLMLARYGKQKQPRKTLPKISQETLAGMIGATRSRVNVFMNKFRKLGFITYKGEIQINNSLLSVVLHE
ncbi:MAG: Crp/Fnr family transcriptional regulator [Candidatus Acidiferrales bacterium]